MDPSIVGARLQRSAWQMCIRTKRPLIQTSSRRFLATPTSSSTSNDFRAAPPIQFRDEANQFSSRQNNDSSRGRRDGQGSLENLRIVPASPSYFTATPQYTDDLLHVTDVFQRYQRLPMLPPGEAPRISWKTLEEYRTATAEPVRVRAYDILISLLKRLSHIHPAILPTEVETTLAKFKRSVQPHEDQRKPIVINQWGVARAVGRRKSSHAQVYLVEGDGECLVNGRKVTDYFQRAHDRESALWALKATERTDKYNVWVVVRGGGTTGQAEAITLGLAKALMAHEPALKPALRRGELTELSYVLIDILTSFPAGVIARDLRRVERKKPGHLKARKMPTWVKR